MASFEFSEQASADLEAIVDFIAADNPDAAVAVVEAIRESCLLLCEFPLISFRRPRLTKKPVRLLVVSRYPNYLIVYQPDSRSLQILRVLRGLQNMRRLVLDDAST